MGEFKTGRISLRCLHRAKIRPGELKAVYSNFVPPEWKLGASTELFGISGTTRLLVWYSLNF